jgi:hypothetical protein
MQEKEWLNQLRFASSDNEIYAPGLKGRAAKFFLRAAKNLIFILVEFVPRFALIRGKQGMQDSVRLLAVVSPCSSCQGGKRVQR